MQSALGRTKIYLMLCLGLALIGSGSSLFVYSNLGSDPLNIVSQGIAGLTVFQVGTVNTMIQAVFFIIAFFVNRKYLGIGSIMGTFIIGFVMNLWTPVLAPLLQGANLAVRLLCVAVAPAIIGLGVAFVQTSGVGMVPNDVLPLLISERCSKASYRSVRIAYDLTQLIIGVILGGVVGIGTVCAALLTGPAIQLALSIVNPAAHREEV